MRLIDVKGRVHVASNVGLGIYWTICCLDELRLRWVSTDALKLIVQVYSGGHHGVLVFFSTTSRNHISQGKSNGNTLPAAGFSMGRA